MVSFFGLFCSFSASEQIKYSPCFPINLRMMLSLFSLIVHFLLSLCPSDINKYLILPSYVYIFFLILFYLLED